MLYFALFLLTARKSYKYTEYSTVEIICLYVSLVDNHKMKPNHSNPPINQGLLSADEFCNYPDGLLKHMLNGQSIKRGRRRRNSTKGLGTTDKKAPQFCLLDSNFPLECASAYKLRPSARSPLGKQPGAERWPRTGTGCRTRHFVTAQQPTGTCYRQLQGTDRRQTKKDRSINA